MERAEKETRLPVMIRVSGSRVDLTCCGLHANLLILNVSSCMLQSLIGISTCMSLRELYASYNEISELDALWGMSNLEIIDLECNKIANESNLMILSV